MSLSREDLHIDVFRIELPRDGTHNEVVLKARACGMRWTRTQTAAVMREAAKNKRFIPTLSYGVTVEGNPIRTLPTITYRLEACNRLRTREGLGEVPETSRRDLERLRDVCRDLSGAIDKLLE